MSQAALRASNSREGAPASPKSREEPREHGQPRLHAACACPHVPILLEHCVHAAGGS